MKGFKNSKLINSQIKEYFNIRLLNVFKNLKAVRAVFIGIAGVALTLSGCCNWPIMQLCCGQENGDNNHSTDVATFTPGEITRLCPTHIGGDRDFNGNGPDVNIRTNLEIRNAKKEIWVQIYLHAKETKADWTEAKGKWDRKLWTAPAGKIISRIESDMSSTASYRDTNHSLDRPTVTGGTLVSSFEVMGDTRGNDVGNCTSDDVYLNVYFNDITVSIAKQ